jgi:hypothetical protein
MLGSGATYKNDENTRISNLAPDRNGRDACSIMKPGSPAMPEFLIKESSKRHTIQGASYENFYF